MFKLKSMPCAIASVLATGALSIAVTTPAMAQEASAQVPQRVVVTGSMISRTDKETPSPVQIITADEIAKTGKTSVAEILSDLASNGQGTLGTGFPGAFANGASGVSLRGMSVGYTLILIDGHRMAPYPLGDDAQRQFVDVSSIPFDLIDRIEVLKDGASALYGSDAVAAVINVILKKSFNGTRANAEFGNSQHGGGKTYKASISTGFGSLADDGYNAFAAVEYRKAQAIMLSQRDNFMWANGDWRSRGGYDVRRGIPTALNGSLTPTLTPFLYNDTGAGGTNNPANFRFLDNRCNYELYKAGGCYVRDVWSVLQPESENVNFLAGFTKKLNDDWQLALKASLFQRQSYNNRGVPAAYTPTSFAGFTTLVNGVATANVGRIANTRLPASHPLNTFGAPARLYGYIPDQPGIQGSDNTAKSTRLAADLSGSAFGWDINAALGMTKVTTDIDSSGWVNRNLLINSILNNSWNVLGGNSPELTARVAPLFSNSSESTLNYLDMTGARDLMQLGAAPLKLALGAHWHKRKQNVPPTGPSLLGQTGNTSAYVLGGEETNTAVFTELAANPIQTLELNASARYDHYDTYGNSFTPGAKFKWSPMKQLSVRGTYAKGFRAPNSQEVGNAGSFFSFHSINDPVLCVNGDPKARGSVVGACSLSPAYVQTTAAPLDPEKSTTFTFGLVVEPIRDLSATLDYYNVKVTGQVVSASSLASFQPAYVRNPVVPVDVADGKGGTFVSTPSVGTIAYVLSPYVNAGGSQTDGVELDLQYRLRMGNAGNLRAQLNFNHMIGYTLDADGVTYQLAGTHGPSGVGGNTGNPKNRATLTLGWDRGPWTLTTTTNWVGSYSALDPSVGGDSCDTVSTDVGGRGFFSGLHEPLAFCRISSFASTSVNVQYKVNSNLTVRASILNVFDRQPPIDAATYGSTGGNLSAYNPSMHQAGAVGRFFSLGANYTF